MFNKIKQILKRNPILYVFSKEYKKETKDLELKQKMIPFIKLKSNNFDIDEALNPLIKKNFKSNFNKSKQNSNRINFCKREVPYFYK